MTSKQPACTDKGRRTRSSYRATGNGQLSGTLGALREESLAFGQRRYANTIYHRARNSLGLTSDTRVTSCRHAAKYRRHRRRTRSSLKVVFSPSPWTVLKLRMRAQHNYSTSFVIVSRLPRKMDGTPLILQLTSNFYVEQIFPSSECVVSVVRIVNKNFDPAQLSIRIFRRAGRRLNGLVPPYSPLNQITQVIPNTLYKRKRIYRHDESDRQLVQIYCHSFEQPP